jgi:TANFOR domain-containing protein
MNILVMMKNREPLCYAFMFRLFIALLISVELLVLSNNAHAQLLPVQTTVQVMPPYSVYLSDYATPGNDKLKLIMVQRDVTRSSYQVKLVFSIELNGKVILRSSPSFNPRPILLDPGVPMVISGLDLQPYLDSRNLDFIGYSRDEYERTKALPEGNYQICVTAYDYRRQEVAVSNPGCSFYWLAKNEPPLTNLPVCASDIPIQNPAQILFSWLPRNTTSPTSVNDTEYQFSLYEVRPQGRNPNDVVQSSQPIYSTVTSATQFVYGPAEPLLLKDMNYAWRVQAIDKNGRDQFRNNGYSEVCTFYYGGIDASLPAIENLTAKGEAERRGKTTWTANSEFQKYRIGYRKKGKDYEWFTEETETDSLKIYELEPDTEYEVRVQGGREDLFGQYSDVVTFKTSKPKVFNCGDELPPLPEPGTPLSFATVGLIVDVQGLELTLLEVTNSGGPGLFKGTGRVSVPYLGGASFNAVFDRLFIDENRIASSGRIDFVTESIDNWVEEELAEQKANELEEQQEENRKQWSGTEFYEEVTYYDDIEIESVTVENGQLTIVGKDELGNNISITNDKIIELANSTGKAIIIEDKNGDQWVVQPGGKVSKVPGGGLSPTMDVIVSEVALDIVKKALAELRITYSEHKMTQLTEELGRRRDLLEEYIEEYNKVVFEKVDDFESDEPVKEETEWVEPVSEDDEHSSEDPFVILSLAFKEKELEKNRGQLIGIISLPKNIASVAEMIAPEIKINDKTLTDFINQQAIQRAPAQETLNKVKQGIEDVLNKLLIQSSLKNSQFNER